jgi:[ribosomal protein S5]-alanine N-acetyltransferase
MPGLRLFTNRLELVAATIELAEAELSNPLALAGLLDVPSPTGWPPPLNDEDSQRHFLSLLREAEPDAAGWSLWFCICRAPRALIGNAGFKGPPREGSVEIGYSMLESQQRNGYCTEAVRALLAWAFEHQTVDTILAHTLPASRPSMRVLEKSGFVPVGVGPLEDGVRTIRYELPRERFQPSAALQAGPANAP